MPTLSHFLSSYLYPFFFLPRSLSLSLSPSLLFESLRWGISPQTHLARLQWTLLQAGTGCPLSHAGRPWHTQSGGAWYGWTGGTGKKQRRNVQLPVGCKWCSNRYSYRLKCTSIDSSAPPCAQLYTQYIETVHTNNIQQWVHYSIVRCLKLKL